MIRFQILMCCILLTMSFAGAKGQPGEDKPVNFSLSYFGDLAGCYHGGVQNGCAYLGLLDGTFSLNTDGMNIWKGGVMFLNIQNTHHSAPETKLAGDLQVFDNIDNGNQTYLYQLWYRQQLGRLWLLAGLHDLNSEFLASENSAEFINSSFGIMPVASLNSPVSIFPNTSMAFLAGYTAGKIEVKAGIYEGDPGSSDADPHNLDLKPEFHDGLLGIIETAWYYRKETQPGGVVRAGFLVHTGEHELILDSANYCRGNYHIYVLADHRLLSRNKGDKNRHLDLMLQAGIAPENRNLSDFYFSAGLKLSGVFTGNSTEIIGIAVAHASISNSLINGRASAIKPSETVAEFFYRTNLNRQIFLQPDFQYIINPGIDPEINNAFVAILRIGIIF